MKANARIILASQSPRRRELFHLIGLPYETVVSDVVEHAPNSCTPEALVEHLGHLKAAHVQKAYPGACVIGADTIVYIDGEILGKPHDDEDARRILTKLQGRTHTVFTGVALLYGDRRDVRVEQTRVTFAPMTNEEIGWYIRTGEPRDKAGAYGIQGPGGVFVSKVEGNYFNVIGMPLPMLYTMLLEAGAISLESGQ